MAIDDAESSESGELDGAATVDPDRETVDIERLSALLAAGEEAATRLDAAVSRVQGDGPPVVKDLWSWEDYKEEFYYDANGNPPTDGSGEPAPFDPTDTLGFDPAETERVLSGAADVAAELDAVVDERTVSVDEEIDEDAFFSDEFGTTTIANRYDMEKTVPLEKKTHFVEVDRYWVNKPYAYVVIFRSLKENEQKYYVIQPHTTPIEEDLVEFLTAKLQNAIKYADVGVAGGLDERERVIRDETFALLERYDLYARTSGTGLLDTIASQLGVESGDGTAGRLLSRLGWQPGSDTDEELRGIRARPEPAVMAEDANDLSEYQVEKLLYYLKRDFIGYERIDAIKHDINVEDISCDGYNSPVFVYHSDYEQIISNVYHGENELDDFVVKLAQRSGKGISKRRPQVDATLPDGSRAQLTLGKEVSDHGTNYTIRQFKDVPFTPVDLINWKTFSLEEMAYLWLAIENNKSLIFAGGTASGKTTSLNAVSLFIPSNSKIVSIEDTREVELPQRNWVASVTRPSFSDDEQGEVDEFDLLEAALRQRPEYIVMGEIRGEEGRTLFQVMSTGHTTLTTFHADSVGEVLKRFTTEPINVSKTMFTALDLVSIQTQTRVEGRKVRRNKNLTEINFYDAENDEINVQDVYQWQAETDEFLRMSDSNTLEEIRFDRGWTRETLEEEIFKRQVVLAYLIENGLNTYTQVAATVQAFINDEETILGLMAEDRLERSLEDLREMESVLIDIDPEKEAMVPRPDPSEEALALCADILDRAETELLDEYRGEDVDGVDTALVGMDRAADVTAEPTDAATETGSEADSEDGVGDEVDAQFDVDDAGDEGASPFADDPDEEFGISFESSDDEGWESPAGSDTDPVTDVGTDDEVSIDPDPDVDLDPDEDSNPDPDPDLDPDEDSNPDPDPGVDLDPESSPDEADESEADESEADIDDWGFGDVTDADGEG
ncbi:secretion system protein E [Haloplanus rallus]|uniref:Secretion system protein E n=1 Tax=Haloplanus rallus TaxID=1816183 RepID=A0A6B9F565_9EURY|nr:type II/IV secretion system ATPase subunit [Haloplanus rallus]QGX94522.1 secretion system protein E [Haloplanus rallus]